MTDTCSGLHDPYEDQLAAARYRAERDQARQELERERHLRKLAESAAVERETVRAEDHEAAAWVRDYGGLLRVKARCYLADGTADEVTGEGGDGFTPKAILDELHRRLMPEGMEWLVEAWPRFDDGGPVRIGDEVITHNVWQTSTVTSISLYDGGSSVYYRWCGKDNGASVSGKCVKRPAPKVLDADGEEIREGDTVWSTVGEFDGKRTVKSVHVDDYELPYALFEDGRDPWSCMCCYLTHRATVIAADGRPLRAGEMVYSTENGAGFTVIAVAEGSADVHVRWGYDFEDKTGTIAADQLTHERPDTRARVIDGMDEEAVERIDRLVKDGRWLDD